MACGSPDPLPGYYYRPVNVEAYPFNVKGRVESDVWARHIATALNHWSKFEPKRGRHEQH